MGHHRSFKLRRRAGFTPHSRLFRLSLGAALVAISVLLILSAHTLADTTSLIGVPLPTPASTLPGLPTLPSASLLPAVSPTPSSAPASQNSAGQTHGPSGYSSLDLAAIGNNPALLQALNTALKNPEKLQPPSLKHLVLGTNDGANASAASDGGGVWILVTAISLVLLWVIVAIGQLLTRADHRASLLRLKRGTLILLGLVTGGAILTGSEITSAADTRLAANPGALQTAVQTTNVKSGTVSLDIVSPRHATVNAQAELGKLAGVEQSVLRSRARLDADQNKIQQLSAGAPPASVSDVAPVRNAVPPSNADQLRSALQDAAGAQNAYQQALQNEYEYFVGVVQDPARRTALLEALQTQSTAGNLSAAEYDLQVVATQVAQEQAIAQSEQQAVGSGSGEFLTPPETGAIAQPFGPTNFTLEPPLEYRGVFYPHFHTGIDIVSALDTPIGAAAPGVVILTGQSKDGNGNYVGYGQYVVIQHADGYRTLYAHLDKILVKAGQVVGAGQTIGLEGSTGWSTGPHLHFEVRLGNELLDPLPFLTGAQKI